MRRVLMLASVFILLASVAFAIWGVHGYHVGCQVPEGPFSIKHYRTFPCDPVGYNNHMPTRLAVVFAGAGMATAFLLLARFVDRQTRSPS